MASSETDLDNLYPTWKTTGLIWVAFGNFIQSDVDALKKHWFAADPVKKGLLQDIWTRHHDRNQSKQLLNCISFKLIFV